MTYQPVDANDWIAKQPKRIQDAGRKRGEELIAEANGLAAVRKLAGLSQAQIAERLGKKQPSVHKMETQADYYVSTLERFVEAAGGTVDILINLPGQAPVRLKRFADLHSD